MSIQFEDQNYRSRFDGEPEGLINWLVKKGIVKSKRHAIIILLVIALLCLILSIHLVSNRTGYEEVDESNFIPAEL